MRSTWTCVLFSLCVSSAFAQTGPRLTEEAATARAGRVRLETALAFILDEPNFATARTQDRFDGPVVRLVYSPADTVEIDVEWTALVVGFGDPDRGTLQDVGDVSLRSKVRLRGGDDEQNVLGARFAVTLPQTEFDKGLGPNTLRTLTQLLFTHRGGAFDVHLNAGLALEDDVFDPHTQNDFLEYGVGWEWHRGKPTALVAEITGRAGKITRGAQSRSEVRLGVRREGKYVSWHAALRRGLLDAQGTSGLYTGLAWTIRGSK